MNYQYEAKSGYYGNGAWVVYFATNCFGYRQAANFFTTEQEAIDYISAK
jgi:hypothetical protein